ncbi:cold-responsive protein kinase 1-like [Neltuma alba]|uniref:cold-responsive protein kinase 1-like n=1 Tax=Neltuma alba TaxID=207710 RepID=UPI0010A3B7A8|nr:cold-responsive protein kinase 1-like [Prosopis alba]
MADVNETFRDIREQIVSMNKCFATAQQRNKEDLVLSLFQCRNYLSVHDCVGCFDAAAKEVRNCPDGTAGGLVIYDGCFLRYAADDFFEETTEDLNAASCGNQTMTESSMFASLVQQVLKTLRTTTPKNQGFFAATKIELPDNSTTIYAFAQCSETIGQTQCFNCLNTGYNNILPTCLPNSEGRAYAGGCFMRYSTTSFFPDNYQTVHITPMGKQGSNKKGTIIGVVFGGVAFALILLTLLAWIKQPKRPERPVPRGDISGVSKLKGPINFSYRELEFATKSFSAENKIGEGGFGAVYKGTLKSRKIVAVKKLIIRQSGKVEEEFESEVKLISKNRGSLCWKQRYDIILGTARGLAYLHEEFHVRIIHRDIKANNILLGDDLQPKITDFGLAKLLPKEKSHLSTKFARTLGYNAPEYTIHGQLSEKADIYSFGIVLLEIISGEKCNELKIRDDIEGEFLLKKAWKLYERGLHIELVDNTMNPNDYKVEEVKKIIEIGLLCTQASAELRPSISEVIVLLQGNGSLENMRPTMPILIET